MHRSVAPQSEREHLKIAFFFRASAKGERLAQRGAAAGEQEEARAMRRAQVLERLQRGAAPLPV